MSYSSILATISGKRPFMLFAFVRDGTEYLYTDRAKNITKTIAGVTGTTWTGSSIAPSRFGDSALAARAEVRIALPLDDAFARSLLGGVGFKPVSLKVWRGFENDPAGEVVVIFSGVVLAVEPRERGVIELVCMTEQAALERKGLAAVMQRPCRHVLYGAGCGLSLATWQDTWDAIAISADGRSVQVAFTTSPAPADGYYKAGVFLYAGRYLWITDHVGAWLTLNAPAVELLAAIDALGTGDPFPTVTVAPGCDLTTATCTARFANLANFGGFPHMTDTPFDGRSIV